MNKCTASLKQRTNTLFCVSFVIMVKECIPQISFEHPHVQKCVLNGNEEFSFKNIKYYNLTSRTYQT